MLNISLSEEGSNRCISHSFHLACHFGSLSLQSYWGMTSSKNGLA